MRPLIPWMIAAALAAGCARDPGWTAEEKAALAELRLQHPALPADPSNRYADDDAAAALGKALFFDARFSANGQVSCATCHLPERSFQDGLPLGHGVGITARRTMPIAGAASQAWFFWDGRKDSLWSQALGPLESGVEHGGDRVMYARLIAQAYRAPYERLFGPLPELDGLPAHATPSGGGELWDAWQGIAPERQDDVNRVFANMGKALAAYEHRLRPGESRFDRYVEAVLAGAPSQELDHDEQAGLRLFLGRGQCTQCHNGPLFTNGDFANIGMPGADRGRADGAREVLQDEFNCLGPYSDATAQQCRELRALAANGHVLGAFKVPSLRGVTERAPYGHAGQFQTLEQVMDHYNRAPAAQVGHSDLKPLNLSTDELKQLTRFLGALSAPVEESR